MIKLTLPYPVSANKYWRKTKTGRTYISEEALMYRAIVKSICLKDGVKPLHGLVEFTYHLYPSKPKDFEKRVAKHGKVAAKRSVRCIDNDNAQKVMFDALNTLAFDDDKQVDVIHAYKHSPDDQGARLEIVIRELTDEEVL